MNVVYNPNTPAGPKAYVGPDQENFLNNFMALYNAFAVNHVPLDAAANAGDHTIINLYEQPIDTQFQTNVGEISIYCKKTPDQTNQIYLRYQGNQDEFPLTTYQIYALNQKDYPNQYFTFLPGGILIYFGSLTVTFPNNFQSPVPFDLFPAVATNIITLNFCRIGTTAGFCPTVSIQQPSDDGIIETINLYAPNLGGGKGTFNYIILANILELEET